jgi:hypothetical protein
MEPEKVRSVWLLAKGVAKPFSMLINAGEGGVPENMMNENG